MTNLNGERRVAGEVGAVIIGPLRYLKNGTVDWRGQSLRSLEAAVASWVVRILEDKGHCFTDLWSPDYDPLRQPGQRTRPELAMAIDGEPAALDVTMFTTNDESAAGGRAQSLRRAIMGVRGATEDARSILGVIAYDQAELVAVSKRAMASQMNLVVDAFDEASRSSPIDADRHQVDVSLPWLRDAWISFAPTTARRTVRIYMLSRRGNVASQVGQFIVERVAKKTAQLAPWGRGILVIVHGFDETAADVRAGFERLGRCPWWRVYWSGPGPDSVELVAAAG